MNRICRYRIINQIGCNITFKNQECLVWKFIKSVLYFILAGLCEIGGGYLIWLWLRDSGSFWIAILGGIILVLYGIVATFQPANFGRVYAAYGGVFIVMAIIWGWQVDSSRPV